MYLLLTHVYYVLMQQYKEFFWRYDDVEHNQDLMRPEDGCVFVIVKRNNFSFCKTRRTSLRRLGRREIVTLMMSSRSLPQDKHLLGPPFICHNSFAVNKETL